MGTENNIDYIAGNNSERGGICSQQDILTGAVIGLARACTSNPKTENTDSVLVEALAGSACQNGEDKGQLSRLAQVVKEEKNRVAPGCAMCTARCGNTDDYSMERLWNGPAEVRTVKVFLLCTLRQMAACIWPALQAGRKVNPEILEFISKGLFILAEDWDKDLLLSSVMEAGKIYLACMQEMEVDRT